MSRAHGGRRVVLAALGSWGDVLPYLAIALGLQERGHHATLATCACYREKVEGVGVEFRSLRPNSDWIDDPSVVRRRSHPGLGLIRVAREWLLPALSETFEDIATAVEGADALVSHPLPAYAARLVAESRRVPWISTMLVPVGFFSAYDGTELPLPPILSKPFHWLGPKSRSAYLKLGARATRFLAEPWYRLRAELGLPPATDVNPLGDSHSPELVLALFSKVLADRQPDWPRQTVVTGFPYAPRAAGVDLPPELDRFLDAGPPPIVFTLGTVVGFDPGRFYDVSLTAARELGCRAVLIGSGAPKRLATGDAICLDYAPFGALLPRASVVVHHGGIGTTGLAMRAGRPMLVMPTAWDQPDNAARSARLGVARVIPRPRYSPSRVASELLRLLSDGYRRRASAVGDRIKQEDGVRAACDAIESHLDRALPSDRSA